MALSSEIIIVRSLTTSDLGLFAAHRATASSKQRAININAEVAQRLLSRKILKGNQARLPCTIIFGSDKQESFRHIGKVGKNWRLGGNKIEGEIYGQIDSKDFVLIKSVEGNDGTVPLTLLFVSRTTERLQHAKIVRQVELTMKDSMEVYRQGSAGFQELASMFPQVQTEEINETHAPYEKSPEPKIKIPPMPIDEVIKKKNRTIKDKVHSPHMLEQMLKVSSDLSAPAQVNFLETVELLASQLRTVLVASKRILKLDKNHPRTWSTVKGAQIGFVDGGLANLSMLGSSPIAARVGGYIVTPGDHSQDREQFVVLKKLINELYSGENDSVYDGGFPDVSAIRDAARISIEAAGAVHILKEYPKMKFLFLHGALVNPVSRYTDIMREGVPKFLFPNFSKSSISELLPDVKPVPTGRNANFISVYLKQLEALEKSQAHICGVVEREATTNSLIRSVLATLDNDTISPYLPQPPDEWKEWFRSIIDPADDDESIGPRITDSLLFRCVLEPGEVLTPVHINRNILRKAPDAWKDVIASYPEPMVSYLQPSEWAAPIRLEIFKKDLQDFLSIAVVVYHCSLLLPRYAFPVGLDIVDKFAKIPNWMSKPVNTNTAVQALKRAMDKGDEKLFDALRRTLCGSSREWLLRPKMLK